MKAPNTSSKRAPAASPTYRAPNRSTSPVKNPTAISLCDLNSSEFLMV